MSLDLNVFDVWRVGTEWPSLSILVKDLFEDDCYEDRILQETLQQSAKTIVVEHEYIDKDYRNVYSGFYSKKFSRQSSRAVRLHFFDVNIGTRDLESQATLEVTLRKKVEKAGLAAPEGTTPGYLGAVVLRPTEYSRIGRTLLDPRKLRLPFSSFAQACLARYPSYVMGNRLEVMAFPHQSQDAQVHTCAETALWSQLRYLSQRYKTYPEIHPHDIPLQNTDLTRGRPVPSHGLSLWQVATILGNFGLDAEIYYREDLPSGAEPSSVEWALCPPETHSEAILRLLQIYVDSGMPPIIGLPGHAVVGFGSEFSDLPLREREGPVIPVTDFLKAIIVNDDNHAPYQKMSWKRQAPLGYCLKDVEDLAVPVPSKVFLRAETARTIVADTLASLELPEHMDSRWTLPLVRRLVCTSSKNYKQFRQPRQGLVEECLLRQPLPHFIWLAEFYPLALWPERKAIIEIALDATAGAQDQEAYLWIRYPQFLFINWRRLYGGSNKSEFVLLPSDVMAEFDGFRGNLVPLNPLFDEGDI